MTKDNSVGLPEKQELKNLARAGRHGDTQIAHVTPHEQMVLELLGGSGTINPETGLREYFDDGFAQDRGGWGTQDLDTLSEGSGKDDPRDIPQPGDSARDNDQTDQSTKKDSSFLGGLFDRLFDIKNITDPLDKGRAGPTIAGLFGSFTGLPIGAAAGLSQYINDTYFEGKQRADVPDVPGANRDDRQDNTGYGSNNPSAIGGGSSPFTFGPWGDARYLGNNPSAPSQSRMEFLTSLSRVTDPNWRRSQVGFGTGDELFDTIYNPLQQGAMDYLNRAQQRGMLDIPSYTAAEEVLRNQGARGAQLLRQRLNEQGEGIIQPLRERAAQLQGQILAGQYDTTPFSDAMINDLFGGAATEVRNRASELGSDLNPFAPPTALYTGLQYGGDVAGSPIVSMLRQRNRSPATSRGLGSRGVF